MRQSCRRDVETIAHPDQAQVDLACSMLSPHGVAGVDEFHIAPEGSSLQFKISEEFGRTRISARQIAVLHERTGMSIPFDAVSGDQLDR